MSRGFVKDYEDQWLHEIAPTLGALISFLTYENNGFPVYEKRSYQNPEGTDMHEMSNGLTYFVNTQNHWAILEEI